MLGDAMTVSLLYFDGCPNHEAARELLEALLAEAGWAGNVERINVGSPEAAERLGFRGSPTVLLDGVDPFFQADTPVGLTCRVYWTGDGIQGVPPTGELRDAIAAYVS